MLSRQKISNGMEIKRLYKGELCMKWYSQYEQIEWQHVSKQLHWMKPQLKLWMNELDQCIKNVSAEVLVLHIEDQLVPVSVSQRNYNDTWINSLYGQFVLETEEEFLKVNMPKIAHRLGSAMIKIAGSILKFTQLKTVTIYPSFTSTTLYDHYQFVNIEAITEAVAEKFPQHMIMFRTMTEHRDGMYIEQLEKLQFNKQISRMVFLYDPDEKHTKNERKDKKKDFKKLKKSGYAISNYVDRKDLSKMHLLYQDIYLNKYSKYNPMYTQYYFEALYENNLIDIWCIKDQDEIIAFMGICNNDETIAPLYFGYVDHIKGLYFMISSLLFKYSDEQNVLINNSAGAKDYKKARGARPHLEYHMVKYNHLKLLPKLSWMIFNTVSTAVATPILKKIEG